MLAAEQGAGAQHARGLSRATSPIISEFLGRAGAGLRCRRYRDAARLARRTRCARPQGLQRGAAAVGRAALFRFLYTERLRSDALRRDPSGPQARPPLPKVVSVADVDRLIDDGARELRRRGPLPGQPPAGAAAALPDRGALRHRPARLRADRAAALGGAARRAACSWCAARATRTGWCRSTRRSRQAMAGLSRGAGCARPARSRRAAAGWLFPS